MSKLGEKLWRIAERHQGYAFISDSVAEADDATVIKLAKRALK